MKDRSQLKRKALTEQTKLENAYKSPKEDVYSIDLKPLQPPVPDFEPAHFVRCHSKDSDPNNNVVKVWRCAFEPLKDKPDESGNILATCGGNIVCFVDCCTGRVLRRYKDNDQRETFYTLAWTTLPSHTDVRETCNVLAVAGEGGTIKLIHPNQLILFASIQAHRKYISCLLFHPSRPQYLFSGGKDGWIMMWDIGTPDLTQYRTDFRPLLKIDVPGSDALNLVYSVKTHTLLAACEDGCFGWNLEKELKDLGKRRTAKVISFISYEFELLKKGETVDGLAFLPGDIVVTKTVGSGSILLWNLLDHIESRKAKRSAMIKVEPLAELEYTNTDVEYLNMGYAGGLLGVGDDLGSIYLYNVGAFTKKKVSQSDELFSPSRIIEWPNLEADPRSGIDGEQLLERKKIVVNGVSVNSRADCFAFGTDNNLVCIMKRSQS